MNKSFMYSQTFLHSSSIGKGELWMTSEHAYHAEKFIDNEAVLQKLRDTTSAHDAYYVAQDHKPERRSDWSEVKVGIMKEILRVKVAQHPYVKKKLLESGDKELIENSWRDDYWGWGPHKDGKNQLGKLWMEVREELQN